MTRVRILVVSLIAPLVLGLAATALQLAWLPSVPDPAAVHWSIGGPDGTGHPGGLVVMSLVAAIAAPVVFAAVVLFAIRRGPFAPTAKLVAVLPLFTVVVVTGSSAVSIGVQRGIASAADAPDITPAIPIVLVAGVLAALAGWFSLPRAVRRSDRIEPAAPLPLAPDERAVWIGRAHPRLASMIVVGAILAALVVGAGFAVGAVGVAVLPAVLLPIVLGVLVVGFLNWRVRVDAHGLTVRSVLGFPTIRVRPAQIESAAAIDVAPMSYGGWGLRGVPGSTVGVITRAGEGILVARRHRGDLVVTVDDAATAAALLTAVAQETTPADDSR